MTPAVTEVGYLPAGNFLAYCPIPTCSAWCDSGARTKERFRMILAVERWCGQESAQTLARHSTISLTMDRYTHLGTADLVAGLKRLPVVAGNGVVAKV